MSAARQELSALLGEARPLVLTNLGSMALGLVDVAVVGRLGAREIAAAGLGNTIFFNVALFGMGVLFALDPLIAQALGAKERPTGARVLVSGLALAAVMSLPLAALVLLVAETVPPLSVAPETAALTRDFVIARLSSLLPFLLSLGARGYLQAHGRTRSLLVGVLAANVVNLPAALVLVHGIGGFAGLGVVGAGLAAGLASLVQLVVTALPIPGMLREDLGRPASRQDLDVPAMGKILRLGVPLGLQIMLEAGSFWIVTVLIGRFGDTALAAHHVALTAVSTTFQIALGIGGATAVRVGRAVGDGLDPSAPRRTGWLGIGLGAAAMGLGALLFGTIPEAIGRAMTSEADVVAAAVPFFLVAACFQLSDGVQTVAQAALRGAGETLWPLVLNFAAHYAVGLPLGWWLASERGLGPVGLWWGLSAGLTAVAILLAIRFDLLAGRRIERA
jgi:MATE family multidrug resistance protein